MVGEPRGDRHQGVGELLGLLLVEGVEHEATDVGGVLVGDCGDAFPSLVDDGDLNHAGTGRRRPTRNVASSLHDVEPVVQPAQRDTGQVGQITGKHRPAPLFGEHRHDSVFDVDQAVLAGRPIESGETFLPHHDRGTPCPGFGVVERFDVHASQTMLREADPITHTWLRLRNTGRAPALDVSWSLIDTRRTLLGDTGFKVLTAVGPYVAGTILLAFMYRYAPDIIFDWREVWLGTIPAALAFALGTWLYGLYLGSIAQVTATSVAGAVFLLLAWIYYSAQILLFGAELIKTLDAFRTAGSRPVVPVE